MCIQAIRFTIEERVRVGRNRFDTGVCCWLYSLDKLCSFLDLRFSLNQLCFLEITSSLTSHCDYIRPGRSLQIFRVLFLRSNCGLIYLNVASCR